MNGIDASDISSGHRGPVRVEGSFAGGTAVAVEVTPESRSAGRSGQWFALASSPADVPPELAEAVIRSVTLAREGAS